jgi:hypothetical protein
VFLELPVAALHLGIVQGGMDDGRPEVVEDDTRDAAEEFEGGAVQAQPRSHGPVEGQLGGLVPAMREHHDEDPGAPAPPEVEIEELTDGAEVDLRFVALHFQAQHGPGAGGELAEEALHRGIAAAELVLLHQQLVDRLALHAVTMQGLDALPIRLTGLFRPAMRPPVDRIGPLDEGRHGLRLGPRSPISARRVAPYGRPWVAPLGDPDWLSMGDPGWLGFPDPGGSLWGDR